MASLETRLSERIREDESLPPLGVSLTNVTYGADDRKAWRKQGKVIWEMAAEAAAVDDEFQDVQKSVKVEIGCALVTPAVLDAMWKGVRHRDVEEQAHDLYELLGLVLVQECGEARAAWTEEEGTEAENWADAMAQALWRMSLRLLKRDEGEGDKDAAASPTTEAAGYSSYAALSDLIARVQSCEDDPNAPDSMPGLTAFIPSIRR